MITYTRTPRSRTRYMEKPQVAAHHSSDMSQSKWFTQPCKIDRRYLPQEILISIFVFTQPGATNDRAFVYRSNPSVMVGPHNPWLGDLCTKNRLTLVCKGWSAPATAVLYGEIVIRRMGQIAALARTSVFL
ncbi:hypothetical protein C8Q80DRAFT_306268 [Daedaleopsis nitida]|nr:hypothetical protein C8Q80DRAFT_306268 [Daedaleopsis nitida]